MWLLRIFAPAIFPLMMAAAAEPQRLQPDPTPLPNPLHCPVDGGIVEDRRFGALWQGKRFYMESEHCLDMFMTDPEKFARRVEPRAALFSAPRADRPSYSPAFLYLGIFVVVGLISGGITSYLGVQKGLSGRNWFALGFLLNIIAIALVVRDRGQETLFQKKGFCKTPQTFDPVTCPACSKLNHPSARRCSGCGAQLRPSVESEVARAR